MFDAPEPVDQAVLDDLARRLRATRRVPLPAGLGWERGMDPDVLGGLVAHWAEGYNWRAAEERIRALPWVRAGGGRVLHARAEDADAPVVVLLHGWPDSVLRFERVLPLLDGLHVVVPALPGYPWGAPVTGPGMTRTAMAGEVVRVLDELGHGRCVVSGGDIGGGVAEQLALHHPERVGALHLTDLALAHYAGLEEASLGEEERAHLADVRAWQAAEGGYAHEQGTKPHTLAVALGDSPAGLLAWIAEKLRAWSDCGGDVESVFPRDDLLTWIMAYWVTGTIGTSLRDYIDNYSAGTPKLAQPVPVPVRTGIANFHRSLADEGKLPREWAERIYAVECFTDMPRGGHFAAVEEPELLAGELRAFFLPPRDAAAP
jgi:pimeloyl-ACP methyl ester carboxylesterase